MDASIQVSGAWGNVDDLFLDQHDEASNAVQSMKGSQLQRQHRQQLSDSAFAEWQEHVQRIEEELQALKVKLGQQYPSVSEEEHNEVLLENQHLKQMYDKLSKDFHRFRQLETGMHPYPSIFRTSYNDLKKMRIDD